MRAIGQGAVACLGGLGLGLGLLLVPWVVPTAPDPRSAEARYAQDLATSLTSCTRQVGIAT